MEAGEAILEKDLEFKFGLTELDTRAIGTTIKPMAKANLFMLMATFMMDSGLMIKLQGKESIIIITVPSIKANG